MTNRPPGATSIALKDNLDLTRGSLVQQLVKLLRDAIRSKTLRLGDRIPATRKFAAELGVSRGTVTTAVEILIAEGLLVSKVGAGVFVSQDAQFIQNEGQNISQTFIRNPEQNLVADADLPQTSAVDFRPCRPSIDLFPRTAWKQCFAQATSAIPESDYGDPRGHLALREEISGYLRRSRGLNASADEIIVTNGAVHAMHLLASLFLRKGSKVIVEDPGYPLARQTFQAAGADIQTCKIDEHGLIVESLPPAGDGVRIVYVTPSHQFPVGSCLTLGRRRALLDWAHKNQAIIVEDDYDGEFRYDVPPLAPLASMENNCVFYCGTFSKILYPGIRIGYAVAPKPLIDQIANFRLLTEYAPSDVPQSALRHFMAEGHFERHILRMRRDYALKRSKVVEVLNHHLPDCSFSGVHSGLHGVLELTDLNVSAQTVSRQAEDRNILVPTLQRYAHSPENSRDALVIGYAASSLDRITFGLERVCEIVKSIAS